MRPIWAAIVVAGSLVAGCGGGGDAAGGGQEVTAADDEVVETTSSTAVGPPSTQAPSGITLPPRPTGGGGPVIEDQSTTTTEAPVTLVDAPPEAILAVTGDAAWDGTFPIPTACVDAASFSARGESGGTFSCTIDGSGAQVRSYFRDALHRAGFSVQESGDDAGFGFSAGSAASVTGTSSAGRTTLSIEQSF